jgi:very-short-patch-repair endonuclease
MSKGKKSGKPRTMKELVATLRRNATRPELVLHGALQFALAPYDAGYVFQHAIGPYVADFFIGAVNLVIEADGSSHDTPWGVAHDAERARFIEARGIQIMRFDNSEIERNLIRVVDCILEECWDLPRAGTVKAVVKTVVVGPVVTNPREVKVTICPPGSAKGSGPDWANHRKGYCGKQRLRK